MWLISVNIFIIMLGIVIWYLTKLFPLFQMVYFDVIGIGIVASASIFTLYRLYVTRAYFQADKPPKWKTLINYMRRDSVTIPLYGQRAYPGESFLDVPHLGLIEFLGRDCYYQWGDKKYIWGLENINFSPDPRYSNLCNTLWELGVKNSDELGRVLNIDRLNNVTEYDLYLMGKIYINMLSWQKNHGAYQLVNEMKDYDGEKIEFKPKKTAVVKSVGEKVDDILSRNPYK
ncbi:MAG: hypothetical protein GF350_11995 [Chitinivibrionales bacterium]|nr:hypothetical protein [Chitinivibrionales bacterium]